MEWLLGSVFWGGLCLIVVLVGWWLLVKRVAIESLKGCLIFMMNVIAGVGLVVVLILMPVQYYMHRENCCDLSLYYDQFIEPNIIEIGDDYVVIENLEEGMFADWNIKSYNENLRSNRYWNSVPMVGWSWVEPDEHLKYVRI